MNQKIIIGITGLSGSGKDTVADYLKNKGFVFTSLSDRLREECQQRNLPTNRDNLIALGNELREKFGFDELAKRSLKLINQSQNSQFVLGSIRHPFEVEFLKSQALFFLINVEVSIKIRFERIQKRGKIEDRVSFEKFKAQEEKERSGNENEQQLDKVISMADFTIVNEGTLEDLHTQIDKILSQIQN